MTIKERIELLFDIDNARYKKFMRDYKELHKCCPECGGVNGRVTLLANIVDLNNFKDYKDTNTFRCDCGSVHAVHDRVREKK